MHPLLRILGIAFVFFVAVLAWVTLGGVTSSRTSRQTSALDGRVSDLWGSPQTQQAPTFTVLRARAVESVEQVTDAQGRTSTVRRMGERVESTPVDPASARVDVGLSLDQRRKGLLWFPLYNVGFTGAWTYVHAGEPANLQVAFAFPDAQGVYDDFRFRIDGVDRPERPGAGGVVATVPVQDGQVVRLDVAYRSRGMREWVYKPTQDVGQVQDFTLAMDTDFAAVDFPAMTMSPTSKTRTDAGWTLEWSFARNVTGYGIGMVMPERIQPGELAADLAYSAALPLGLFFLWIYVLGLLRGIEIHPINYLFVAAAFFAFNLLFSYTADHLEVEWAFALASATSLFLVASYLRLVVGPRSALVEAGLAQLVYQVGFSLAHFWDGFTGLTITVLGILTLFALMQLTGRVDWNRALSRRTAPAPAPG